MNRLLIIPGLKVPKGKMVFLIVLITGILLSTLMGGCQPIPPAEEIRCGESKEDLVSPLRGLGKDLDAGIKIEICIPGGEGMYQVVSEGLDQDEIDKAFGAESPFDVRTLVAYFQVQDKNGKVITEFEKGLELRVSYPLQAWQEASERSGTGQPRLAYLIRKEDRWAVNWIEFTEKNATIEFYPPGEKGQPDDEGLIIITIRELEDPVIGGC